MPFKEEFMEEFKNANVRIAFIPKDFYVKELKRNLNEIKFSNPNEYLLFLQTEMAFWKQYENNTFFKTYVDSYSSAISYLHNAAENYNTSIYLNNSLNSIAKIPNSKSILTKELIKNIKMPYKFFDGFINGISNSESSISNNSKYYLMGLYKAFQYIGIIKKIDEMLLDQQECFENTQISFINTSDEYIKKYDELMAQKNEEFLAMDSKINVELQSQKEEHDKFLQEKYQTMNDLELLYAENLRLKKPAEYWSSMSKDYEKKAKNYIGWSVCIGAVSVLILTLIIIFVPEASKTSHWFDLVKNTAILTIITTILVYTLRIFVKMAMSSYHLARDAREREQLTYFYLSLINEKAITGAERELVITSLFSRSDTGLLKGDASPEMPTINLGDIINKKHN